MSSSEVSVPGRRAGQHAQSRADRLSARLLGTIGLSVLVLAVAFLAFDGRGLVLVVIELTVIAVIWLSDRLLGPAIGRWARGASGERRVGVIVEELSGAGWQALHDVSLGRGNIDHVLVGPGGTFTIETKSQRGRLRLERLDPRMLKQAYAEKKLLEKVSGLQVEALLVFSEAWLIGAVPAHRKGVTVLPARMLAGYLQRRRIVMSEAEATEIGERLRLALEVDALGAR